MDDKKIVIKLKKQELESEKAERRQRNRRRFICILLCIFFLCVGLIVGQRFGARYEVNFMSEHPEMDEIQYLLQNKWLYANEYDNLEQVIEDKALYGMTSFEEDPYTSYQSISEHDNFTSSINMTYVGIGVTYTLVSDIATFTEIHKGSPAEKAGLMAGDILKSVDGKSVSGLDTDTIRSLVTGPEGSVVKIGVEREGQFYEYDVERAKIDTSADLVIEEGIPVLTISTFGDGTYEEVAKLLEEVQDESQLIIDLRDNSGGFQTSVEAIASLFLGDDALLMQQVYNDGTVVNSYTNGKIHYDNFEEIVLLINENTASAAEVLTIALKEVHPNTTTVGTTTVGKGVVQSNIVLNDGSYIKLTTSKWLSPKGKWINDIGIQADHEVKLDDILYERYEFMEEDEVYQIDMVSDQVRISQMCLEYLAYGSMRIDGYFDLMTQTQLMQYQEDVGLEVNGLLDKQSYEALISSVIQEFNYNPARDLQKTYALDLLKNS